MTDYDDYENNLAFAPVTRMSDETLLTIAKMALQILAKSGNELAKAALKEIEK